MHGEWHDTSPDTRAALEEAMGATSERPPDANPVRVVRTGRQVKIDGAWELECESGETLAGRGPLPPNLPLGYHQLRHDSRQVRLIVSPGRCPPPSATRSWGWAVQLYALRSAASWGMGDLGDLARLTAWAAGTGAGTAMVNPLHAPRSGDAEASPYYPSSRCAYDPSYLDMAQVPGIGGHPALPALRSEADQLNSAPLVDRKQVWQLKSAGLEWVWDQTRGGPNFEEYARCAAPSLSTYACFAALSETNRGPWPRWPEEVRHPSAPGVPAVPQDRLRFHMWLQWLLDLQLAAAGGHLDLVTDLAVGVDPDGADAWMWQDCFALGTRVGAPPDAFNPDGQDWGLPPLIPWRLRAAGFEPFVATLRAALRRARGVRIDHVMGLFRLWWIPPGAEPSEGAYVRYPASDLLDILAVESTRAGAYVVGEDLGTVEPSVRAELAERGVLSYRLVWFEPEPPGPAWPAQSMAAVTTHDLPTVAGCWSGADVAEQRGLGLDPDGPAAARTRDRVAEWAGLNPGAPMAEVIGAVHRLLAEAPSMIVAATLDDALGVERRPNIPGTTAEVRPNWCLALPATLEQVMADPVVAEVARALGRGGS
ncbi:MAG: 4-alpha-glucanotransferase [Acidimicrobiales bacterium]